MHVYPPLITRPVRLNWNRQNEMRSRAGSPRGRGPFPHFGWIVPVQVLRNVRIADPHLGFSVRIFRFSAQFLL